MQRIRKRIGGKRMRFHELTQQQLPRMRCHQALAWARERVRKIGFTQCVHSNHDDSLLVVVNYLDIVRIASLEAKVNTPLVIDANTPLAAAIG